MIILVLAVIAVGINLLAFNTRYYGLKSLRMSPKHIDSAIFELAIKRSQKSVLANLKLKDINLK